MTWWNVDRQLNRAIVWEVDLLACLEATPRYSHMVFSMDLDSAIREGQG